jgi:hypothetical protein
MAWKITWTKALCIINRMARDAEGLEAVALEMAASVVADVAWKEIGGGCVDVDCIERKPL